MFLCCAWAQAALNIPRFEEFERARESSLFVALLAQMEPRSPSSGGVGSQPAGCRGPVLQWDRGGRKPSGIASRLGTAGSRVMGVFTFVVWSPVPWEHCLSIQVTQGYSKHIPPGFPGSVQKVLLRISGKQSLEIQIFNNFVNV